MDRLAGVGPSLLGAKVYRLAGETLHISGRMEPVYVGGTVIYHTESEVTTVSFSRSGGKPRYHVHRFPFTEIEPRQTVPTSYHGRCTAARNLLAVLGSDKGPITDWERTVLGYCAQLANPTI